eukprot:TRINITY_DN2597_c0_g1_i4.p3 TRINITY_DN2597_c0_g1~~TRINITY_DN2597_c0_g1_i4.p3  ORF type:complete len:150 (+),score=35.88 TRINITY_DN2597_c0_g1_i4:449-898(+)
MTATKTRELDYTYVIAAVPAPTSPDAASAARDDLVDARIRVLKQGPYDPFDAVGLLSRDEASLLYPAGSYVSLSDAAIFVKQGITKKRTELPRQVQEGDTVHLHTSDRGLRIAVYSADGTELGAADGEAERNAVPAVKVRKPWSFSFVP